MNFFSHVVLLAVYAAAAAAVAIFAPAFLPKAAGAGPHVYGALTLAILALVHAVITGLGVRRASERDIDEMRAAYDEVMYELSVARSEARRIHDAILEAGGGAAKSKAMSAVVDEVKVLKGLIERLADNRASGARQAAEPAMAGAPAISAPAHAEMLDEPAVLDVVRRGLEANRVDLYLQPIVSLPQRKRRYYECFSRIRDAHGRVIVPDQYIRVAEREGLITVIDNILLFRCVQLVRKAKKMEKNVRFFYNMSARTLADTTFFPEFLAFLSENPDLAGNLRFEFTQADIAELSPEASHNLEQLGERGFRFSLDQVSRMDMNFAELSRRCFRYVKVDAPTLIAHFRDLDDTGELKTFQDEVESSAVDIIVEKIEDELTLVEILDYGIDFGQGYLFGEPRLAKEA